MYTEEELQESIECLEKRVEKLENVFDSLISLLMDNEAFSQDIQDKLWGVSNLFNND